MSTGSGQGQGALLPGQLADLTALAEDNLSVPEERIKAIESVLTVVGGRIVYGVEEYVVFLGFALGGSHDVSISASLIALGAFLAGATWGGRLVRASARAALPPALALVVLFLLAAVAVAALTDERLALPRAALLILLAMPMGLQNAAVRHLAVPDMTTTVLTLTLTGIAADSSLAGGTNPRMLRRVGAVVVMLLGAVPGACLLRAGLAWTIAAAVLVDSIALADIRRLPARAD